MQKISIKNLGPIREFESDLLKMNLLIGEQATGKSTICKSVYFFRTIRDDIVDHLYLIAAMGLSDSEAQRPGHIASIDVSNPKQQILYVLKHNIREKFKQIFGTNTMLNPDMKMTYNYGADIYISLSIPYDSSRIKVRFSDKLRNELKKLERKFVGKLNLQNPTDFSFRVVERSRIHKEIKYSVSFLFDDFLSTYYIPAGRQLMALLSSQKTQIDYARIDWINRKFMQFCEFLQNFFKNGINEPHEHYVFSEYNIETSYIAQRIIQAMKGDYQVLGDQEYLVVDENHKIPLNYASSGQQEVLWVFLQIYALMLRDEPSFVIIEEPEAHLYPTLQHKVFEFITEFTNLNNSAALVTTHSPYMLTSANVLYYAGRIAGRGNHGNALQKILHPSKYVHPDQFTAWKLNVNGAMESLVDEEYEDLRSSLIDEVSEEIDRLYTKLYYYEVEHEKQK